MARQPAGQRHENIHTEPALSRPKPAVHMKYAVFSSFLSVFSVLPGSLAVVADTSDDMGKKKAPVDFEEEWTKISDGNLEIKWYYFPTTQSLNVDISKIKEIKVKSQANSYAKNWGSGDLTTWWACDMKRNFRSHPEQFSNVKIDIGETFKKGFTVQDVNAFLTAIRRYYKDGNIVYE